MKHPFSITTYLILLALSCFLSACENKTPTTSHDPLSASSPEIISFSFTVNHGIPIGYGYTYRCQVIPEHQTPDFKEFTMTVLVGDTLIEAKLNHLPKDEMITGIFQRDEAHVPYNTMPITGFVDPNKTAWRLLKLE